MISYRLKNRKLPRLRAKLTEIRRRSEPMRKAAQHVKDRLEPNIPVFEGTLRDSVRVRRVGDVHFRVEMKAKHAVYVEYGTSTMAPRAPMRKTMRQERRPALRIYENGLKVFLK